MKSIAIIYLRANTLTYTQVLTGQQSHDHNN